MVARAFALAGSKRPRLSRREFGQLLTHVACHHQLWLLLGRDELGAARALSVDEAARCCAELEAGHGLLEVELEVELEGLRKAGGGKLRVDAFVAWVAGPSCSFFSY